MRVKFEYEPISNILNSKVNDNKNITQDDIDNLKAVSHTIKTTLVNQFNAETNKIFNEIVDITLALFIDRKECLDIYELLLELKKLINCNIARALWFSLENIKTVSNRVIEREYKHFVNQPPSYVAVLGIFIRLFGVFLDADDRSYLDSIKESMKAMSLSEVNRDDAIKLQLKIKNISPNIIIEFMKKGDISSAIMYYEVYLGVYDSLAELIHRLKIHDVISNIDDCCNAVVSIESSNNQRQDNSWFYDDILTHRVKNKLIYPKITQDNITIHSMSTLPLHEKVQFLLSELTESLDLIYRSKGNLEREQTKNFYNRIIFILKSPHYTKYSKEQLLVQESGMWKRRMIQSNSASQDLIINEVLRLISEIISQEIFNAS